jgi:thiamine biosynthesis lipoprotein
MGTRFELLLPGEEPEQLRAAGEAALEEIDLCHRRLTRFEPSGLVAHLHRAAAELPLDAATFGLFEDALVVWRATGGAFDLTLPVRRMDAIALDPVRRTVRLQTLGLPLDFGAIAKGHALDLAAAVLREAGVTSAFLHGGTSSAIGIGAPESEAGWKVALGPWPGAPTVRLHNTALSVSSAWFGNPHPTIDPRTGMAVPVPRHVAVVGPSARLADAWSTALLVLGERPLSLGPEWSTWLPGSIGP